MNTYFSSDRITSFLLVFLFATLIGSTIYLGLMNSFLTDSFIRAKTNYDSISVWAAMSVLPRYGTVQTIDLQKKVVTVSLMGRYTSAPYVVALNITDDTILVEQHLEGTNGVYTGLSAPIPSSYADLHVGDRVMTLVKYTDSGTDAQIIVFGDPI
jgi:hypothetical protein